MTSLPITPRAPQTAASGKQTSNAADTGNTQNSQPFGEVLARQINEPVAKDTKTGGKLAVDALAQLGTDANAGMNNMADDKKTDVVATDGTTPLPADIMAALLPQAMNTANMNSVTTSGTDGTTGSTAIDATTDQGKRGITALKTNIAGTLPTAPKATTAAVVETQARETPVATTLTAPDNRTSPAAELNTTLREAVSIATQQPNTDPQTNAAALASLQNTAANIAAPAMQPVQVTVNTPVNQDKWSDEFSQKITWLASSNHDQMAELHLNPPHLGPLDVVIKVSGDQATALFTSPHAAVREAVEQAMPRLRDMLADNGIMLGNTTVSDQAPRDQSQTNTQRSPASTGNIQDVPAVSNSTVRVSPISRHNGIVDTFA
jgi:flagellar hook-length control protein FliK